MRVRRILWKGPDAEIRSGRQMDDCVEALFSAGAIVFDHPTGCWTVMWP